MSPDRFRGLALSLPETTEHAHMDHPDFRVRGRIFATLHPKEPWGMVRLTPVQQRHYARSAPKSFVPVNGAWGARGATYVVLRHASAASVRRALLDAWRNTAPRTLVEQFESGR